MAKSAPDSEPQISVYISISNPDRSRRPLLSVAVARRRLPVPPTPAAREARAESHGRRLGGRPTAMDLSQMAAAATAGRATTTTTGNTCDINPAATGGGGSSSSSLLYLFLFPPTRAASSVRPEQIQPTSSEPRGCAKSPSSSRSDSHPCTAGRPSVRLSVRPLRTRTGYRWLRPPTNERHSHPIKE